MLTFVLPTPLPAQACRRPPHAPLRPRRPAVCCAQPPPTPSTVPPVPAASPTPTPSTQSCGFAALLGPSNTGKSTLLNNLVGHKVAIVTPKVQTTRCRVAGIASFDDTQVIFLDTPGIFEASNRLSRAMVKTAWVSGAQADTVCIVLDAAAMYHNARRAGLRRLHVPDSVVEAIKGVVQRRKRGHAAEVCLCANKMDAVPEEERAFVEERMQLIMDSLGLTDVGAKLFPISARYGDGVTDFREWVTTHMPPGPWLYPDDDLTDMPARLLAAEVTREKAFMVLKQELPYEIAVDTTSYKERDDGSIRITQDILVNRNSQKGIVTGHQGSVVKTIGMKSRLDLQEVLGTTVHLMLTVKVRSKWKEDKRQYEQWGLDYNA